MWTAAGVPSLPPVTYSFTDSFTHHRLSPGSPAGQGLPREQPCTSRRSVCRGGGADPATWVSVVTHGTQGRAASLGPGGEALGHRGLWYKLLFSEVGMTVSRLSVSGEGAVTGGTGPLLRAMGHRLPAGAVGSGSRWRAPCCGRPALGPAVASAISTQLPCAPRITWPVRSLAPSAGVWSSLLAVEAARASSQAWWAGGALLTCASASVSVPEGAYL